MKLLECKDLSNWREWLRNHHKTEKEVWLLYYKKGSARKMGGVSYEESIEEALCYGWVDSLINKIDEARYARKFTPRQPGSKWSETNKKRIAELQKAGRLKASGRKLVEAAMADGSWDAPARPTVPTEVPAELLSLLEENSKHKRLFETLPPSHRRQFMAWIAAGKRDSTRSRRAEKAIRMIQDGESPSQL